MSDYDHTLDAEPYDYDYDAAEEEDRDRKYDRWLANGRDPQDWEDWMEEYEDEDEVTDLHLPDGSCCAEDKEGDA